MLPAAAAAPLNRLPATLPAGWAPRRAAAGLRASVRVAGARGVGGARWWAGGSSPWGGDGDSSPLFDLSGGTSGLDGSPATASDAVTTIFCSDGSIVTLGPQRRHPLAAAERRSARRASVDPLPLPEEQGLCIGSVFSISASNGVDTARRLTLLGFCYSAEQLFERVEDTVLARGGEVWETQRQLKSGVHECLSMSVAIPYLFGVPPEFEHLKAGIKTGAQLASHWLPSWECRPWLRLFPAGKAARVGM